MSANSLLITIFPWVFIHKLKDKLSKILRFMRSCFRLMMSCLRWMMSCLRLLLFQVSVTPIHFFCIFVIFRWLWRGTHFDDSNPSFLWLDNYWFLQLTHLVHHGFFKMVNGLSCNNIIDSIINSQFWPWSSALW